MKDFAVCRYENETGYFWVIVRSVSNREDAISVLGWEKYWVQTKEI